MRTSERRAEFEHDLWQAMLGCGPLHQRDVCDIAATLPLTAEERLILPNIVGGSLARLCRDGYVAYNDHGKRRHWSYEAIRDRRCPHCETLKAEIRALVLQVDPHARLR